MYETAVPVRDGARRIAEDIVALAVRRGEQPVETLREVLARTGVGDRIPTQRGNGTVRQVFDRSESGRVHLTYTEPHPDHGTWTCPPVCCPDEDTARGRQDAITGQAGPDAATRRTWTYRPCDCGGDQ